MFDKVLVALDGSENANHALNMTIDLVNRCDATLVLFHAVHVHPFRSDYDIRVIRSAREAYERIGNEQAESILNEAEQKAAAAGVKHIQRRVAVGEPVKTLLQGVADDPVDLIVIGTRGLSGLQELALGSVAHKVSIASPCPVLIVK